MSCNISTHILSVERERRNDGNCILNSIELILSLCAVSRIRLSLFACIINHMCFACNLLDDLTNFIKTSLLGEWNSVRQWGQSFTFCKCTNFNTFRFREDDRCIRSFLFHLDTFIFD
eukprot:529498_1